MFIGCPLLNYSTSGRDMSNKDSSDNLARGIHINRYISTSDLLCLSFYTKNIRLFVYLLHLFIYSSIDKKKKKEEEWDGLHIRGNEFLIILFDDSGFE